MARRKSKKVEIQPVEESEHETADEETVPETEGDDAGMDEDDAQNEQIQPEPATQKDKSLMEFLEQMDDYQPIIPDAVLDHYFMRSGFDCPDLRVKRFLALAAQKFISDIAQDSYQYCKIRQQGLSSKDKKQASKKTVLTMEDLSVALSEYGVNTKRPDYYT